MSHQRAAVREFLAAWFRDSFAAFLWVTIESCNNRIRVYLARLRRKTHCYSKSLTNLTASILLYLLKNC